MKLRTNIRDGKPPCSPAECASAGRHGDAKDSPTVYCEHCHTFRWNGVDMCGKKIGSRIVLLVQPDRVHVCTRPIGHEGECKWYKLEKSYTPR